MRILIIHNRYLQKGGEDTVFEQERDLLIQSENVQTLVFQNLSGWRGGIQFCISIWNIFSARKIKRAIRKFKPDIVHMHNWHYAIGPLTIRTVHKKRIPIVLTVQNFRLLCPSGTLLFRGALFLDSIHAYYPWKAVQNKVYRNSWLQTFWLASLFWFHKNIGTWKKVDRFILQTGLAKKVFVSSTLGIHESRFSVKPNFIRDPGITKQERGEFMLYIGRLSVEKGIGALLAAFENKKMDLYIGGDGPLKELVINACNRNSNLHYVGLLDMAAVRDYMKRCSALIFPSVWYEGMPLTLIEAFAEGTPVIGSNIGAMSSMIVDGYNGFHFNSGDAADLSEKIDYWAGLDKNKKSQFCENARASYENNYTPERNKEKLLTIYRSVMENKPGI